MRITKFAALTLSAGLLAIGAPATAQEPATEEEATEAEIDAANRIVCRRQPAPTGSRIGARRVCKTQHEWDLIRAQSRESIDAATSRNTFGNEGG